MRPVLHIAAAFLAGGGEEGAAPTFLGLSSPFWQAVNLVLFIALLVYLLRKPLSDFFGNRRKEIAAALAKAADERRRAEEIAAEPSQRLEKIEGELADIRIQAEAQAHLENEELERIANEEARRIVARASAEMENRIRSARAELTAYAADLAVEIARDILAKGVTPQDHERLFREAVKELGERSLR